MPTNSIKRLIKYSMKMKKNYVTPEMEDFKYEIPSLYQQTGDSSTAESGAYNEGGSGTGL